MLPAGPRSNYAQQIIAQALQPRAISSPFQGLAQMAQVLAGMRMQQRQEDKRKTENRELAELLYGPQKPQQAAQPTMGTPAGGGGPHGATLLSAPATPSTATPTGVGGDNRLARALVMKYGAKALPMVAKMGGGSGPPKSRTVSIGDKKVTQEWNAQTRQWENKYEAPRYRPGTNVRVDIGGIQLPKSTRANVAKAVMSNEETMIRLDQINELYNPRFSTFQGQGRGSITSFLNRAGITQPEERRRFAMQYEAWRGAQRQYFNSYRKWVTGVAAGPKEMADIRASIPNTSDGPDAYRAKMQQLRGITQALIARDKEALQRGLRRNTPQYRDFVKSRPLTATKPKQRLRYNPKTGALE